MGKYLEKFLEKLPEQTIFDDIEVVLDHNEPTDREVLLVQKFQSLYPGKLKHVITNPVEPIGVSWNRCVNLASGKYLAIWNIDDLRTSNSLEMQVRAFQETPSTSISSGPYIVVDTFGSEVGEYINNSSLSSEEHLRGMTVGPFFMFPKALCKRIGMFDEQLRSGADFDMALRLLQCGPPKFVDTNLGWYLNEGTGTSTRPDSLQPIEADVVYCRYGIWDKLRLEKFPDILEYDVHSIRFDGKSHPASSLFENYEEIMAERKSKYFPMLSKRYSFPKKPSFFGRQSLYVLAEKLGLNR